MGPRISAMCRNGMIRVPSSLQDRLGSRLRSKQPLFARVIGFATANRPIPNRHTACHFPLGESFDRCKRELWRLGNLGVRLALAPALASLGLPSLGADIPML